MGEGKGVGYCRPKGLQVWLVVALDFTEDFIAAKVDTIYSRGFCLGGGRDAYPGTQLKCIGHPPHTRAGE